MSRPRTRISCDASFRDGYAAIAGVLHGRDMRVLFLDITKVKSSGVAERIAMERAMQIARSCNWSRVVFRTDLQGLTVSCKMPDGWMIEVVPRKHNVPAHTCASQALKLWEAGRAERATFAVPL